MFSFPLDLSISLGLLAFCLLLLMYGIIKKAEGAIFFGIFGSLFVGMFGLGIFCTDVNREVHRPLSSAEYEYSKTDRWLFVSYEDLTLETNDVYLYNNIGDTNNVTVQYYEGYDSYGGLVRRKILVEPVGAR